jgi:hypothetical protein
LEDLGSKEKPELKKIAEKLLRKPLKSAFILEELDLKTEKEIKKIIVKLLKEHQF